MGRNDHYQTHSTCIVATSQIKATSVRSIEHEMVNESIYVPGFAFSDLSEIKPIGIRTRGWLLEAFKLLS